MSPKVALLQSGEYDLFNTVHSIRRTSEVCPAVLPQDATVISQGNVDVVEIVDDCSFSATVSDKFDAAKQHCAGFS